MDSPERPQYARPVISKEENALFTTTDAGTPMGEMLRRYWLPVGASEFVTTKPQRVKVLGEELVVFRGEDGQTSLMQLRCAHRSLALDYGRVEGECIRCPYHGWLYDRSGQCLEQPAEPEGSSFHDKVKLRSYRTQEAGGLVFGYLGPDPAPLLPLYDVLMMTEGVKEVRLQVIHANWFNHVENVVDVSHLAWLHGYTFPGYGGRKVSYHWDRKPYGADNVMTVAGSTETHVSCYGFPLLNRFSLPAVEPGGELVRSILYRVPIDQTYTQLYFVHFYPSEQRSFHTLKRETKLGEYVLLEKDWWGIDVIDQDRMAVEQQGVIADRVNERLGASDGGIILMRQMMRDSLAAVAEGRDPLCIIRDPAEQNITFPQKAAMMNVQQPEVDYSVDYSERLANA
jgi:5,5'-dehydrodivanillate O-demethylase oxygenase subunit